MSLDVYLSVPGSGGPERQAIFIRDHGATREISAAEWMSRFPGREPVTCLVGGTEDVYHRNITHNLIGMADAAGLYGWLWRPDDHGVTTAGQLLEPLRAGLACLAVKRAALEILNPVNGWGTYDNLVAFTTDYLAACERWPQASVRVWR